MRYLTAADVLVIHEGVINSHELQGLASDKSVDAVVARIENRIAYGLIDDVFELAACYGIYIAVARAFNDANKRTGFAAMDTVLALNDIELVYEAEAAGDQIRAAVLGQADEKDVAAWLRAQAG